MTPRTGRAALIIVATIVPTLVASAPVQADEPSTVWLTPVRPSVPIPGETMVPGGATVTFSRPVRPERNDLEGSTVTVANRSEQAATVSYDGRLLTVSVPSGRTIRIRQTSQFGISNCVYVGDQFNAVQCAARGEPTPASFVFNTVAGPPSIEEAALDLSESRPCIPATGRNACDSNRAALWQGDAAAWAAQGVTNPDSRFNETVVLRVRAGDPAAISSIARVVGAPYLQVTRIRFVGEQPDQADEYVDIANLGGGAQDLMGWSLRLPRPDSKLEFGDSRILEPGQTCRVHTAMRTAETCVALQIPGPDIWPDSGGEVVLTYEALALPGANVRYSADPTNQPPPPNLQLVR